ncbi:MAG: hypothetical protein M1827_004822 [Pycnora praestabilis]|nr:MAG: hypothetical protein M1827_004822 [Pycnora praestabilis]
MATRFSGFEFTRPHIIHSRIHAEERLPAQWEVIIGMGKLTNAVADTVLQTFEAFPTKYKPRPREDGSREWIALSGIVLSRVTCTHTLCSTGLKCLPQSKIHQAKGIVLHDWHAEVLAIRSFNKFLIQECHDLAVAGGRISNFVRRRDEQELSEKCFQPFTVREDTHIHMYCSEAPCGDASMELTMSEQEDATPWAVPTSSASLNGLASNRDVSNEPLHGRGYFSELGTVRRKPSRPDAFPTLSKSCSDKLALAQCTSLLLSPTTLLLSPKNAYLHTLILPESQFSRTACVRAFGPSGRMAPMTGREWSGGYSYRPFSIESVNREFAFSRRNGRVGQRMIPSNVSAVYTPYILQTLINGVLQGRKQFDPRGASEICRKGMWKAVVDVVGKLGLPGLEKAVMASSYEGFKEGQLLRGRRDVKADVKAEALKGWKRNEEDDFVLIPEDAKNQ